jgi:hypothetical protein
MTRFEEIKARVAAATPVVTRFGSPFVDPYYPGRADGCWVCPSCNRPLPKGESRWCMNRDCALYRYRKAFSAALAEAAK